MIYSNGNHYDAFTFQGSRWENEQMTLSLINDRSTSATRPHIIQSSFDNAAYETLLTATRCSKRKIADSTQEPLPIGKKLHSQSIRSLQTAYNEQLNTLNEASKENASMNKRKHGKYDKSKESEVSRILAKSFRRKLVRESTLGNAKLTKTSYNNELIHTRDLLDLIRVIRPYPPIPLDRNTCTRSISARKYNEAFGSRWLQHVNS
jgi:hypothetical protein